MRLPSLPVFVDLVNALDCSADALLADSVSASNYIVLDDLSKKLQKLPPEHLAEVTAVVEAMLGYMQ